jgi:hypothetical protein
MFKILYSLFASNQTFVLIIILVLAFIYLTYQFSKKYRVILNFRKFAYDSPTLKLNTTPIPGLSDPVTLTPTTTPVTPTTTPVTPTTTPVTPTTTPVTPITTPVTPMAPIVTRDGIITQTSTGLTLTPVIKIPKIRIRK